MKLFQLKYLTLVCLFLILGSISSFAQFIIGVTIGNATCSSDSNGVISLAVSGGTAPYNYQWLQNGPTSPVIAGLKPGTYTVVITDSDGTSVTASYWVGPAPIQNDSTNHVQAPICTNDGYIQLNLFGGTPPYQQLWNTGETNLALAGLGEGNYSVQITDNNSCTASFSFQLLRGRCLISSEQYFTPNGDGHNDTWIISNSGYFSNARLIVFNRWGSRVYEHNGLYEPWDGKSYLGIPVPDAVYYYFFYLDKSDKEKEAIRGSVTIIR